MKLRSRPRLPTHNSSGVTATAPVVPPSITRLQTPPISERSNDGSIIERRDRLSELPLPSVDMSDAEEKMSRTKDTRRPTTTAPAAPLTTKNLAKHQEEITSAVETAPRKENTHPPPTPTTRLIQMRNFLVTEDMHSYPRFATRMEQIEQFLREMPQEKRNIHHSIYHEVKGLLRSHKSYLGAATEPSLQRRPRKTAKNLPRPIMSLPAETEEPEDRADPWSKKLDDLTRRVRQSPNGGHEAYAASQLRELARPLNRGRLPSADEAYRLIYAEIGKENRENEPSDEIDYDQLLPFEQNHSPSSEEQKFSQELWSRYPPKGSKEPALRLGEGSLMPQEMKDIDWDRDRSKLDESLVGHEDVDDGDAQLLFAETPFLQKMMSDQISSDLATRVKKGEKKEPVAWKPAVLMTQKFALPRPAPSKIVEAAEIAKSLSIQPDLPTPSPRTAFFRKRKFEQVSDSEFEEEGEDRRPETPVDSSGIMQGGRVYVDEAISSEDSLFDGSVGPIAEMSGALQDLEGEDLHLYSAD